MNLGFDIDGVIANFAGPLINTIKTNYGVTLTEKDIYCFDLNIVLGITRAEETAAYYRNPQARPAALHWRQRNTGTTQQRRSQHLSVNGQMELP